MESLEIKQLHPHPNSSFQDILTLSPELAMANVSQNPESSPNFFNAPFFPPHIFSPNTNSYSTESNLHETQQGASNERRLKRMKSNRESARRSRMRKKRQIEELQCQVNHLQAMNHQLSEKVIHLLESNHQIIQENSLLKERVSSLQAFLSDLLPPMKNLEDKTWSNNQLQDVTSESKL